MTDIALKRITMETPIEISKRLTERRAKDFYFNGKLLGTYSNEQVNFIKEGRYEVPYYKETRMGICGHYGVWHSYRGYNRSLSPPIKIEILRNEETKEVVENISIFDWVHERVLATNPPYFRLESYISFLIKSVKLEDLKHSGVAEKIYRDYLRSEYISFGVVACISFIEDTAGEGPPDKGFRRIEDLNAYREIRHAVAHYFNRAENNAHKSRKDFLEAYINQRSLMGHSAPLSMNEKGRIVFDLASLSECMELTVEYLDWKLGHG